ncbi:glycosyltransferase [Olivibacter sp. SA151]|uniref:glycosyltransferase family 2 protein n=1 Tax=Olivibacter jilunii TaxID=985016 RepID=UPI003F1790AA
MPKVSVIIPNYNHGKYLRKRIDSVLNQTFRDFEMIILDDASTDGSKEIIEDYRGHGKIKTIIYNQKNSGNPFHQWHKGIMHAKGQYIWIAESDDWCDDHMLQYLIDGIEGDEKCTISYCQSYCIDGNNQIRWRSNYPKLADIVDGITFINQHMISINTIFNASMAIWRREIYDQISHDFQEFRFAGDKLFWIRLAAKGKVSINGRLMNYFRKHDADVSGKAIQSGLGYLEDMRILNIMYIEDMIDKNTYYKGFKKFFREYWQNRHTISSELMPHLKKIFSHPLTSKDVYYKAWLSAVWRKIQRKY